MAEDKPSKKKTNYSPYKVETPVVDVPPPATPSEGSPVLSAFLAGSLLLEELQEAKNRDAMGVFRGGSGGLWLDPSTIVGCQRKALLRYHGVDAAEEKTAPALVGQGKQLMFQAGVTNEDSWYDVLSNGHLWPILREEQIPIIWQLPEYTVTGRPDLVLMDLHGEAQRGVELKLLCSAWTARAVAIGNPKLSHLRQAALYMWRLSEQQGKDVPFELWYTNRVNYAIGGEFMLKLFPKEGQRGSQYFEYKDVKVTERFATEHRPAGTVYREIKACTPFIKGYMLRWTPHDRLQIKEVATEGAVWEDTIVTKVAIDKFYSTMHSSNASGVLPPRPTGLDHTGKKDFDECSYCKLAPTCDKFAAEGNESLTSFLDTTRTIGAEGNK